MKVKTQLQLGLLAISALGLSLWFAQGVAQTSTGKAPAKAAVARTDTAKAIDLQRAIAAAKDPAAAIVYDKDGKIHFVSPDGKPIEQCQLCTPELEAIFGKNCLQAGKPEHAKQLAALTPKLCRGAGSPQTSLKGLSSISGVRHSGSECYTWYVCDGVSCEVYQYCW